MLNLKDRKFLWGAFLLFCYRIGAGKTHDNCFMEGETDVVLGSWITEDHDAERARRREIMQMRDRPNGNDTTAILPVVGKEFEDEVLSGDNQMDYIRLGKELVRTWYDTQWSFNTNGAELPAYEVYCVWFSKTLKNWKGLFATTRPDNIYIEITHNGEKGETYIDAYRKIDNVCVPDGTLRNGTYA